MESEQTSLSSAQFLEVVRRRALWIVLCVLVAGGAVYAYAKHKPKKYTATAEVAFNNNQLDQQIVGLSIGSGGLTPQAQQQNDLELVRVGRMAAKTARSLRHGLTEAKVSASVSAAAKGETNVVAISATSSSPLLAAGIANTYVTQLVRERQRINHHFFKSALAIVSGQLARLAPAQRFGTDGLSLQNRAQTLALLAELGYNDVEIAQYAAVPSSPSSPKVGKDTGLGVALGLLVGLAIAFLLEHRDRRIRRSEELESIYGVPILGSVPKSAALGGRGTALSQADAEAFGLIRAHLRFFNMDRELRTVMIASPASGDGKTTIACHLAKAAARSGSRVLLVELDLRQPSLAERLDVQVGLGLTDVLVGSASIDEATQSIDSRGGEAGTQRLHVLTAGGVLPPNPSEVLESQVMSGVLAQLRSAYDLVVIDTPPLMAVSDAFSLLPRVDGVVIVGWVGRSRRDLAEDLQKILVGSSAPILGVVANGAKSSGVGSYPGPATGGTGARVAAPSDASSSGELVSSSSA